MDFSTNNLAYDLNGNLQSMIQMGIRIGTAGTVKVDDLSYRYQQFTNKLLAVTDNGGLGTANGSFGDFKDGNNGTADDYVYDENGNLVVDMNKNVQNGSGGAGITYNFLDKPVHINIAGKGTIDIVYDADGSKLQRIYKPTAGGSKTTTYINGYVYEQKISAAGVDNGLRLQFISFEEGRIRVVQKVSNGITYKGVTTEAVIMDGTMDLPASATGVPNRGAFDFFIRDQQQNTRMVLTEESHSDMATCTMETARQGAEYPIFQGSNEMSSTYVASVPGWSNTTAASKLGNLAGSKIGPNSLLKVMSGDQITTTADYFYQGAANNNNPNNTVANSVLTSLFGVLMGGGANLPATVEGSANATAITGQLGIDGNFNNFANGTDNNGRPKAYLNILFFDERFQFVKENSTSLPVGDPGERAFPLTTVNAPKNGYAYIYVSNASDQSVFFDNLKVGNVHGRIIEEDHYYAYGLKIAGLSSQKLDVGLEGHLKNDYLYNGKELVDDADLDWYEYGFRNYDPQIGRFVQLDPLTWQFPMLTNYQYASCEPIANVDMDGLESVPTNSADLGNVVVKGVYGGTKGVFTHALTDFVDGALPVINAHIL